MNPASSTVSVQRADNLSTPAANAPGAPNRTSSVMPETPLPPPVAGSTKPHLRPSPVPSSSTQPPAAKEPDPAPPKTKFRKLLRGTGWVIFIVVVGGFKSAWKPLLQGYAQSRWGRKEPSAETRTDVTHPDHRPYNPTVRSIISDFQYHTRDSTMEPDFDTISSNTLAYDIIVEDYSRHLTNRIARNYETQRQLNDLTVPQTYESSNTQLLQHFVKLNELDHMARNALAEKQWEELRRHSKAGKQHLNFIGSYEQPKW